MLRLFDDLVLTYVENIGLSRTAVCAFYVCLFACMLVCMYVCMYICMYVRMYINWGFSFRFNLKFLCSCFVLESVWLSSLWPTSLLIALSPNFGPIGFLAFQGYCWVKDKTVFKTVTFHQCSYDQHVSWDATSVMQQLQQYALSVL